MNYGPLIFLAAFFALAGSWFGFVLTPQVQVGRLQQTNTLVTEVTYPLARPGVAREGIDVYRANGCAACHSQQVRQTGTVCNVMLTDAGTNQTAILAALAEVRHGQSEAAVKELLTGLPRTILKGVKREQADVADKALKAAGAKTELWIVPVGPDIARGWGKRRTVADDFLFDYPVMLGSQRVGPDLANVGLLRPDANWQLLHLYSPRLKVPESPMPPYRFLFEKRRIERARSPDALDLPGELAPPSGYEIVPMQEAKSLVAYLLSLRADAPLFVAPLTVPAPAPAQTNAPATNAPAGSAEGTNAPAK
jgi:cbb3-type cytochrome oxidase cytochrome c subunit